MEISVNKALEGLYEAYFILKCLFNFKRAKKIKKAILIKIFAINYCFY